MHSPQFSGQGCGASTQLSLCVGRLKRWYIPPQNRHFTLLYGQMLLWSFSWARRNEPTQPCWHFLSEYSHCAWWLSFSWCSPLQEHPGTVHCTLILAMIACRGTEMLNWVWLIVARQSEQPVLNVLDSSLSVTCNPYKRCGHMKGIPVYSSAPC